MIFSQHLKWTDFLLGDKWKAGIDWRVTNPLLKSEGFIEGAMNICRGHTSSTAEESWGSERVV